MFLKKINTRQNGNLISNWSKKTFDFFFCLIYNFVLITLETPTPFKHIQTIRRLLPTNCLSVFDHFVRLVLKWLNRFKRLKG